jgi:phosphoadenosine phosphosulfate reductase
MEGMDKLVVDIENLKARLVGETAGFGVEELLGDLVGRFGDKIGLATSFGAEDQVLTDMLCKVIKQPVIFTLDTGRLPEETYEVMEATRKKYGIEIEVLFPERAEMEEMVNKCGPNLFYGSIEARKLCCRVRKIGPLRRKLSELDVWICGLRAEQSVTRTELEKIECDNAFGLIKVCPLADWSLERVWEYIRKGDVPYNKLHDGGFPSIGCEPCTRAVKPGEDVRAGRWWWEEPEHKECGLHLADGSNEDRDGGK